MVLLQVSPKYIYLLTSSLYCGRVDFAGATLAQSKPRFPLIRDPYTSIPRLSTCENPTVIIGSGIKALANSSSISKGLADVLEDMSYLTTFIKVPRQGSIAKDITYFDDWRASIEYRILTMAGEEYKLQGNSRTLDIHEPCRLGALIYTNMVFRELQPGAAIHTTLTGRLRAELMQTNLISCWGNLRETLLWVLFIGGSVAVLEPIRLWFVSVLATVCCQMKILSWHDIRKVLVKYLWSDRIWEDRCKYLWFEVERSKMQ
jgi:hypothetical protein